MNTELYEILKSIGHPVFLQGSLTAADEYPAAFFTYWCFEAPEGAHYDNQPHSATWGYWVYSYADNPATVDAMADQAREKLRAAGWTTNGRPIDANSDEPSHTGKMFEVYKIEQYKEV